MTATYHFFDNPKVTWEKVIQPHQAATRQRMAQQPVVLLVQDTTEIDVTCRSSRSWAPDRWMDRRGGERLRT